MNSPFKKPPKPTARLYYYWRKPPDAPKRVTREVIGTIYAKILCNGTNASFSTGVTVPRSDFSNGKIYPSSRESQVSRSKIEDLKRSFEQIKIESWHNAKIVWGILVGSYKEGMYEQTIIGAINYGYEAIKDTLAIKTQISYTSVVREYELWINKVLGFKDISLGRMNIKFTISYMEYLQEKGLMDLTALWNVKILASFYNTYVIDHPEHVCPANPFRINMRNAARIFKDAFKARQRNILENCLSESQIQDIIDYQFTGSKKHSLNRWKHVAVWQIFTGFAFDDLGSDDWRVMDVDGFKMIELYRGKTKNRCIIPMLPEAEKAFDFLKEEARFIPKAHLFPFPLFNKGGNLDLRMKERVYAQYSRFLSRFSDYLGFDLRSHLFRHTFGMMMSRRGVSIEAIAAMLGHSTTTTTMNFYVQPEDKTILGEVNKAFDIK